MRRVLMTAAVLVFAGTAVWVGWKIAHQSSPATASDVRVDQPNATGHQRIISLAPSVTEVLFALGLGDSVVGVTRYCDYPPQAAERLKVGGYFDVNYEAVMASEPDLVVLLEEHEQPRSYLKRLKIETLTVDHSNVAGILRSIQQIAERTGATSKAQDLLSNLQMRMEHIEKMTAGYERPRVMVAVGRNMESGVSGEVYVSGRDGYYDGLITMAGGVNAYDRSTLKFPALSAEGVARLNPDVILEMAPDMDDEAVVRGIMDQWRSIPGVNAVRDNRIHLFTEDYAVVPGPRFINLLEWMAKVIQPEAGWD